MRCWTTSATSPRPAAEPPRHRAGFTIFELLIVVGVVLAVGAIAVPFTLRQFERRTETEAIDRLGLLIRSARAEARSSGMPVEVHCDPAGRLITALRVDPRDPPSLGTEDLEAVDPADDGDSSQVIPDAWASIRLPDSLAIIPMMEDGPLSRNDFGFDSVVRDAGATLEDPDPWEAATRLLLLAPDGTTILLEDLELRASTGRRRISIDPWTALMSLSVETSDDQEDADETLEESDDSVFEDEIDAIDDVGVSRASESGGVS